MQRPRVNHLTIFLPRKSLWKYNQRERTPYNPLSNHRRSASGVSGEKYAIGHGAARAPPCENSAVRIRVKLRQIQKIRTWNVCGLLSPGKYCGDEDHLMRP